MDDVTWGALALTLTLLGGAWTWWAFRHRGASSGTRGVALTLLPAAAWLTGTLELGAEIGQSVTRWATHLVLSPVVWAGVVLAGLSVVLFVVAGLLPDRRAEQRADAQPSGRRSRREARRAAPGAAGAAAGLPGATPRQGAVIDDDLADIEALLRKRGIE